MEWQVEDDDIAQVHRIIPWTEPRICDGKEYLHVSWKGYNSDADSWESREWLEDNYPNLVDRFLLDTLPPSPRKPNTDPTADEDRAWLSAQAIGFLQDELGDDSEAVEHIAPHVESMCARQGACPPWTLCCQLVERILSGRALEEDLDVLRDSIKETPSCVQWPSPGWDALREAFTAFANPAKKDDPIGYAKAHDAAARSVVLFCLIGAAERRRRGEGEVTTNVVKDSDCAVWELAGLVIRTAETGDHASLLLAQHVLQFAVDFGDNVSLDVLGCMGQKLMDLSPKNRLRCLETMKNPYMRASLADIVLCARTCEERSQLTDANLKTLPMCLDKFFRYHLLPCKVEVHAHGNSGEDALLSYLTLLLVALRAQLEVEDLVDHAGASIVAERFTEAIAEQFPRRSYASSISLSLLVASLAPP